MERSKEEFPIQLYYILAPLVFLAISSFVVLDAYQGARDHQLAFQKADTLSQRYSGEASTHLSAAAVHRAMMMEDAVKDAPAKAPSEKRLALSLALAANGTGFEDQIMSRIKNNATDAEIEGMRVSFLTSLFQFFPPALKNQEGIQMQMDGLLVELKTAGVLVRQAEVASAEADAALSMEHEARMKLSKAWPSLLLFLLSAIFGVMNFVHHNKWLRALAVILGVLGLVFLGMVISTLA